eukprot:4123099-Ditylum_brightwellii.AAC.1
MRREIIARRLMTNVEKRQYLDNDQHRRCNGRTAIYIVLGKTWTFDTAHVQHANLGCTDCNAKACYDQILPIVLLLMYFKAGLPYTACLFFAKLLYQMRYHVTTAYGKSIMVNYFGLLTAVFGICQGSTDGISPDE